MSRMLTLALGGLRRVLRSKAYSQPLDTKEAKEAMFRMGSTVKAFLEWDAGRREADGGMAGGGIVGERIADVRERYADFCAIFDLEPCEARAFTRRVNAALGTHVARKGYDGDKVFSKDRGPRSQNRSLPFPSLPPFPSSLPFRLPRPLLSRPSSFLPSPFDPRRRWGGVGWSGMEWDEGEMGHKRAGRGGFPEGLHDIGL